MKSQHLVRTMLFAAGVTSISLIAVLADTTAQKPVQSGGMFGDSKTKFTVPDPIVEARTAVDAARKESVKSDSAFNTTVTKLKKDYEASDDYKKLQESSKQAEAAYKAVADPIDASLKTNPQYVAALAAADKAQKDVDDLSKNTNVSMDERSTASKAEQDAREKVDALKKAAYDADPNVKDLKTKWDEAKQLAMKSKKEFDTSGLKENPDWIKAKSDMEASKGKLETAKQNLNTLLHPPAATQAADTPAPEPVKPVAPKSPPKKAHH